MTHLQTIDKPENDNDDDILSEKEDAFEGLADIVDNLDNANGVFWFTIWGRGGGGPCLFWTKGKKFEGKSKLNLDMYSSVPNMSFRPRNLLDYQRMMVLCFVLLQEEITHSWHIFQKIIFHTSAVSQ